MCRIRFQTALAQFFQKPPVEVNGVSKIRIFFVFLILFIFYQLGLFSFVLFCLRLVIAFAFFCFELIFALSRFFSVNKENRGNSEHLVDQKAIETAYSNAHHNRQQLAPQSYFYVCPPPSQVTESWNQRNRLVVNWWDLQLLSPADHFSLTKLVHFEEAVLEKEYSRCIYSVHPDEGRKAFVHVLYRHPHGAQPLTWCFEANRCASYKYVTTLSHADTREETSKQLCCGEKRSACVLSQCVFLSSPIWYNAQHME